MVMLSNLNKYKALYRDRRHDASLIGTMAVVDISRDPDKAWGPSGRVDDLAPCLTTANHGLWVFSLGTGDEYTIDRYLAEAERASLQGFPLIDNRTELKDARRVYGNAMSVPVAGRVLFAGLKMVHACLSHGPDQSASSTDGNRKSLMPDVSECGVGNK